jgi:anti-sigma B factor antagonist
MNADFAMRDVQISRPVALIELAGRLNSHAAHDLHMRCEQLHDDGFTRLIVNMSDVTFIASSGAGTLVKLTYDFLERGGFFQLAAVSDPVMRVIDLLNSRQFLNIAANADDAMAKLDKLKTAV